MDDDSIRVLPVIIEEIMTHPRWHGSRKLRRVSMLLWLASNVDEETWTLKASPSDVAHATHTRYKLALDFWRWLRARGYLRPAETEQGQYVFSWHQRPAPVGHMGRIDAENGSERLTVSRLPAETRKG